MAKPEWGTKRTCLGCGAKFYDMGRSPITCPACDEPFAVAAPSRSRRSRKEEPKPAAPAAVVAADQTVSTKDDEVEPLAGEVDDLLDDDDDDEDDAIATLADDDDDEDEDVLAEADISKDKISDE
ncbi:MAG: TIGR02300 family protein [Rhodospirillaceae bacterium]|nr:TIGR02300 family protein [Rhodospirillaceae bacterium]